MKKLLAVLLSLVLICAQTASAFAAGSDEVVIVLSGVSVTVNGQTASSDPSDAVYLSHDIIYYEDRDTWDNGNPYGEGAASERHSAEEAEAHTVVNITQPGTYRLSGKLSLGQICVNISKGKSNPDAVRSLDGIITPLQREHKIRSYLKRLQALGWDPDISPATA